jgi:hypothetical protein
MTLPINFEKWCTEAGLVPEHDNYYYLVGHNYRWRINDKDYLQRSCTLSKFDRWANSVDLSWPMPKKKDTFFKYIKVMSEHIVDEKAKE